MKPLTKPRLFAPGPTPVLPRALLEPVANPMHHRKEDFRALYRSVQAGLQQVFKTRNEVLILTCSGSGAMEASLTNLLAPGEKALIATAGKFGERWVDLAEKFGVVTKVIDEPYGKSIDPGRIGAALSTDPEIAAVFVQACETSTGAVMDLEGIAKQVRERSQALLVVDGITGIGSMPIETDAWGIDVLVGGSQKAFMVPPGIAMLAVGPSAWEKIEGCKRPRYYFDLLRERRAQKDAQTAFTPAIPVVQGLKAALDLISEIGVDGLIDNAGLQAGSTRAAVRAWGMTLLAERPSDAVTAFFPPGGVEPGKVISILREQFGAHLSGGQGALKGRILRIGHVGYFDFLETLGLLSCLELAFLELGVDLEAGSGSRAAMDFYKGRTRKQ